MARKTKAKRGTRQSTINKRRKGALAVVIPWMKRFGAALGVIVFTIWVGAWLWLSGSVQAAGNWAEEKIIQASADAGFRIDDILVEGRENADTEIILAIINMRKGDPVFAFDPQEAQEQLEKISWVREAHVERRLPDTLYIRLDERMPLALYNDGKTLRLLDEYGEAIATDHLAQFKDLIVISGKGAPEHLPELAAGLYAQREIRERVKTARRIGERRWDLELKSGITVKMPEDDVAFTLARLANAQKESALLDKDIKSVDLRESDRIAVRTKPGQVEEYRESLKKEVNAKTGNNI